MNSNGVKTYNSVWLAFNFVDVDAGENAESDEKCDKRTIAIADEW